MLRRFFSFRFPALSLLAASTLFLAGLWPATSSIAQQKKNPEQQSPVLRVTTRLVLVDVIVTDKQGKHVTDLTAEDFILKEDGKEQNLTSFSLEQPPQSTAEPAPPVAPSLPPHVYTNRFQRQQVSGPLTILLLDLLNTPLEDQAHARNMLLDYVTTQLQPGQRVAVLSLTTQLWMLQDFTSDPTALLAALKAHRPQRDSLRQSERPANMVPPDVEATLEQIGGGAASSRATLEAIRQMDAEYMAVSIDRRVKITLGALLAIGRMTAGYPGRKNLVWISAGFPLSLDPSLNEGFAPARGRISSGTTSFAGEIRRGTNLLTAARVAIYPVDARGLVGWSPELAAGRIPSAAAPGGLPVEGWAASNLPRRPVVISTQMAMEQLATETGGRVFKDRNDIDNAVAESLADGSTYYLLGYRPSNRRWDGKFRSIKVEVARKGVRVRHRHGYYALDTERIEEHAEKTREEEIQAALTDPVPATGVTFRVEVRPSDPAPLARVQVNYRIDTDTLLWQEVAGGAREARLEFYVAAYNPKGKQVHGHGQMAVSRLDAQQYERAAQYGLAHQAALQLEPGSYRLRLIVRDARTGLLGRVDALLKIAGPGQQP